MDYNKEWMHILGQQIEKRFSGVTNIGGIDVGLVEDEEGIHWGYKGVECHVHFYKNGEGIDNLFFNLKFQKKQGLAELIDALISASEVDKSKYFRKLRKEYVDEKDIDSYTVRCSVKKIPETKKQRDNMLGYVWGNLIGPMLGKATGIVK